MFPDHKKRRRSKRMPLWMATSLIALLSVGALVLSYIALTGAESDQHPGLPVKSEVAGEEESTPLASPELSGEEPEPVSDPIVSSTSYRLLAMVGSTAVRATSGSCEHPGTVEISADGAQSWSASETLSAVGATQILRLLPTDPFLVQVVALDRNCEPQVYQSGDLGASWEGPLPVLGTWYFNPSTPNQVGAPSGILPLDCEGEELAPAGDRAAVRCRDGSVITTDDRGFSWSESGEATDVQAITYSSNSYVVAQLGTQTCEGLRIVTLIEDPLTGRSGCFEASPSVTTNDPTNVALAQSGTTTLLWVGDDLVISTDGGSTWL